MRAFAAVAAAGLVLGLMLPALAQGVGTPPAGPGQGAPGSPSQGGPGYGPGGPGYGPGPWYGPGWRGPGTYVRRGFEPGGHPGAGLWIAGLFTLLRLLLLVGLILVAWRVLTARTLWGRPDPATALLRERFARGEISEDEYRKRLATLA